MFARYRVIEEKGKEIWKRRYSKKVLVQFG